MEEKYEGYYKDSLSWLYASDMEELLGAIKAPGTPGAEIKDGKSAVEIFVDELSKTVFSAGGISWDAIDAVVDRACDKAEHGDTDGDDCDVLALNAEMKRLYEKIVKSWIEIYGEEQVDAWLSEIDGGDGDK